MLALVSVVEATTMTFKSDGHKYVMVVTFLRQIHLDEGAKVTFYDKNSICVAKWVV